jgi:serine protease Do
MLSDAIQKVMPSVVRVRAVRRRIGLLPSDERRLNPLRGGEWGEIIFEPMPPGLGQISEGAGVIWRADGYIVTTFSIVNRADRVEVTLNDGRTMEAKLTGVDPTIDLAVVKADADKLPTATLGDASKVRVGEPVFAIGHPANFTGTVITGIVSGLNRTLPIGNQVLLGLIQTDLAIAPGFSGGPLANARGEIIGINVAQFRPPQPMFSNQPTPPQPNLSFALSISEVKRSADEIIAHGKVFRPFLGVQLFDVDEEKQRDTRLPDRKGAFVANVPPDSPARRADIRVGDVIRRIGEKEILNAAAAMGEIRSRKPGDKLTIEIWRDGAPRTVEVTLADMPREPRQPAPPFPPSRFGPDVFGPIEFGPPRPALRILAPKDNEIVKGNVPIRLALPERERFAWVGVWVDEQFVAMSKLSAEPFTLDTTKFPNGVRVVRVKLFNLHSDAAPGASVRVRVENER